MPCSSSGDSELDDYAIKPSNRHPLRLRPLPLLKQAIDTFLLKYRLLFICAGIGSMTSVPLMDVPYSESEAPSLNPATADQLADAYNVRVAGGPNTTMVLSLPEILNHIFTFNSKASNLNCALVCKEWKDLALDHVWAELPGPKPFVLLLAPLVESDTVIEGRPSLVSVL